LNPPEAAMAKRAGLDHEQRRGIWTCPSRPDLPVFEAPFNQWVIGYQYFGGIRRWMNDAGSFPSYSPVKLGNAKPNWVLAADTTMKVQGQWGYFEEGNRKYVYFGMPSHRKKGNLPSGGNQVHVDGSAKWVNFFDMYFIHSWAPGTRKAYFYQEDLGNNTGDLGVSPSLPRLKAAY
jgi:hypothetical protein